MNQSRISNDVHYHTERNKTEKELQQESNNRYHDAVLSLSKNGAITSEARAELERLKFQLGLDADTAAAIENAVKNEQRARAKASNDGLSIIGKMALKSAMDSIRQNSPLAKGDIAKLGPICRTTMNGQVNEAETVLSEMTTVWEDRPEINVVINACVGTLMACGGNLEECRDLIIEYLTQSEEDPSEEIGDLFNALMHLVGVVEEDRPEFAFYNERFFEVTAGEKSKMPEMKVEEKGETPDDISKTADDFYNGTNGKSAEWYRKSAGQGTALFRVSCLI